MTNNDVWVGLALGAAADSTHAPSWHQLADGIGDETENESGVA
jgi:hypothetical protein